jgi:hypothetical protein
MMPISDFAVGLPVSENHIGTSLQLIRRTLIADKSLQNLIEGRVYTSHFIDYDNKTTPMPLVILDNRGGSANYSMKLQRLILHIYAYSERSSAQAADVYNKVYTALNGQELARSTLSVGGYMYEQERPLNGFNEQIRGWFYRGTFILNSAG